MACKGASYLLRSPGTGEGNLVPFSLSHHDPLGLEIELLIHALDHVLRTAYFFCYACARCRHTADGSAQHLDRPRPIL
ncbi:hypothetical protein EEB15_00355 [Ramlibacter sp. WS9]|nr:hypothetical protein EEB15_00355 [Ramlibacter sp. WS9]